MTPEQQTTLSDLVAAGITPEEVFAVAQDAQMQQTVVEQTGAMPANLPTFGKDQSAAVFTFILDGAEVKDVDSRLRAAIDAIKSGDASAVGQLLLLVKAILTVRPTILAEYQA